MHRSGLLLLAAACGTPPTPDRTIDPAGLPVRHALPAGTVVRVLPVATEPVGALRDLEPANQLWRTTLQQSAWFDFAGGIEDVASNAAVAVFYDAGARRWSTALLQPESAAIPLASVENAGADALSSLDALALQTRRALGDPVDEPPLPATAILSADPRVLALLAEATSGQGEGDRRSQLALAQRARPLDPACTVTLMLLAESAFDLGDPEQAARTANEALGYDARLAPTTRHRLARTLILARTHDPRLAREQDAELTALAQAGMRERPFDPHVRYTAALAANLAGDYARSAPLWRELQQRWPRSGPVAYHLAFAELGTGNPKAALDAVQRARGRLPETRVLVPRILALHALGRDAELAAVLTDLAADPEIRHGSMLHGVLRMQAAHALLIGDRALATRHLLDDLEWLRQRPSQLDTFALDLVEAGEVLLRLGQDAELASRLTALQEAGPPAAARQGIDYLLGRVAVARGEDPTPIAAGLTREGSSAFPTATVWGTLLQAAWHGHRGELLDEATLLGRAALRTQDPLVHAALARAMRQAGKQPQADVVTTELQRRLDELDLRDLRDHPLLNPASALASLAVR